MPLRSKAQAEYLEKNLPEVFEKFKADTPEGTHLPERVKPKSKSTQPKQGKTLKYKRVP